MTKHCQFTARPHFSTVYSASFSVDDRTTEIASDKLSALHLTIEEPGCQKLDANELRIGEITPNEARSSSSILLDNALQANASERAVFEYGICQIGGHRRPIKPTISPLRPCHPHSIKEAIYEIYLSEDRIHHRPRELRAFEPDINHRLPHEARIAAPFREAVEADDDRLVSQHVLRVVGSTPVQKCCNW
jgi:hypothetical protein